MQEKQTISDPRAQLNKLLECCGKPELSRERIACEDGSAKVTPVDSKTLWIKLTGCAGVFNRTVCRRGFRPKERSYQSSEESSRTQVKSGNAKATEKLWHNCREIG